jgi:hypothetical protein
MNVSARDVDLPDLVVGIVDDARELVEAQVSSLKTDLGDRLGDLGTAIKSWLFAVCVAIVTTMLLGLSIAATLTELGIPWFASLWIVTAIAIACVVALVYRARASGRKAATGASTDVIRAVKNTPELAEGN